MVHDEAEPRDDNRQALQAAIAGKAAAQADVQAHLEKVARAEQVAASAAEKLAAAEDGIESAKLARADEIAAGRQNSNSMRAARDVLQDAADEDEAARQAVEALRGARLDELQQGVLVADAAISAAVIGVIAPVIFLEVERARQAKAELHRSRTILATLATSVPVSEKITDTVVRVRLGEQIRSQLEVLQRDIQNVVFSDDRTIDEATVSAWQSWKEALRLNADAAPPEPPT